MDVAGLLDDVLGDLNGDVWEMSDICDSEPADKGSGDSHVVVQLLVVGVEIELTCLYVVTDCVTLLWFINQ